MAAKYRKRRKNGKKKVNVVLAIILALFLSAYLLVAIGEELNLEFIPTMDEIGRLISGEQPSDSNNDCEVHFIDVGQGDCTLIISDGKTILIDAGENDQGTTVVAYLKKIGIQKIDLLMPTHPHSDHIGGMDIVIDEMEIGKIVMPRLPDELVPTTRSYTELLTSIANKGLRITPAKPGAVYEFGQGKITIIGPNAEYDDLNNMSLVCQFTYGTEGQEKTFLFTGDIESPVEKDLLNTDWVLKSDVLKVAHHGSSTSTSKKFYKAVNPDYCVILVGDDNSYNHPNKKTLETIRSVNNAGIYRTDFQGSIVFGITEGKFQITCER